MTHQTAPQPPAVQPEDEAQAATAPASAPSSGKQSRRLVAIVGGVVIVLIGVVVALGAAEKAGKSSVPDVELSVPARDTLIGSANRLESVGRHVDASSWRYDTPACVMLSDYFGGYLTSQAHRDMTADDIKATFMAGGAVGRSLRAHIQVFNLEDNALEITEAAMACAGYIAAQH